MTNKLSSFFLIILLATFLSLTFANADDIFGSTQNDRYLNNYFGFSIQFPKGWKQASVEQMKKMSLEAQKIAFGNDKNAQALLQSDVLEKVYLFTSSAKPIGLPSNVLIKAMAIKIPMNQALSASDFVESMKFGVEKISKVKPTHTSSVSEDFYVTKSSKTDYLKLKNILNTLKFNKN